MAKNWGSCDYKQLQKLRDNLVKLQGDGNDGDGGGMDKFCQDVSKELAARLLALVIPRTPVGNYKGGSYSCVGGKTHKSSKVPGKVGGTLRRGWTAQSEREAECTAVFGGGTAATTYAKNLPVTKAGNEYRIEVINPVHYASYVEFGHRTADGMGWVEGHYFLTLSEQDLRSLAPGLIEKKLEKRLREVFHV